jgi:hypothetical protein
MTTETLLDLLKKEIELIGEHTYSQRRQTIIEMLRMRGVKI